MNPQELEVQLKLLEEKQKIFENRLADVDECCGKLKGTISAEVTVLNERIVNIEHNMDTNCKDVEIQLRGIEEQTKTQFTEIGDAKKEDEKLSQKIDKLDEKLDKKISKITGYYMTFTIGILVSMAIGLISLMK